MRNADRATIVTMLLLAVVGCDQLDGRSQNRKGNAAFRDQHFLEAVAHYEHAIKTVPDPTIHYNLALAYSKVFHPGSDETVLLDTTDSDSEACKLIPNVKTIQKQVCVKPGDKHFMDCDAKNVCPSSFTCQNTSICTLENKQVADLVTLHFAEWMKAHPDDLETRALMTQAWIDSDQFKKAIDYWEGLDKAKPNDPTIIGSLAGIYTKANDWRKSIEWYLKLTAITPDPSGKAAAYQFIGNVAWAKLNSHTLTREDMEELADRGIGALQAEAAIQPENPKPIGLMGSIFNFRGQAQGVSWASAIDRASAEDLRNTSRVLTKKAKDAAGQATPATGSGAPATGSATTPTKAGG
ncbi:MAG: hypothetical protein QM831_05445 [Kofleriaceae bacterium]